MPTLVKSAGKKLAHDNYSATVTPATKTLPKSATSILIQNMDATNNVLVSFDSGVTYKTVLPNTILALDIADIPSYQVKSSASTVAVECLYSSEI